LLKFDLRIVSSSRLSPFDLIVACNLFNQT